MSREPDPIVRCRGLTIGWRGRPLLPPFDADIRRGRFVALVGRNGSGKSTFMKTLLGETRPLAGIIERSPDLRHVAYVPQSSAFDKLLPLTVRDVVAQGRLHCNSFLRPFTARRDRDIVARSLETAGVAELSGSLLRELSKGQRQRVMFARMLATEAELALLDEPTAAMDVAAEREAIRRLSELAAEHDIAVVLVTHALTVAERFADDVMLFDREGGEVLYGPRDAILASAEYARYHRGDKADAS